MKILLLSLIGLFFLSSCSPSPCDNKEVFFFTVLKCSLFGCDKDEECLPEESEKVKEAEKEKAADETEEEDETEEDVESNEATENGESEINPADGTIVDEILKGIEEHPGVVVPDDVQLLASTSVDEAPEEEAPCFSCLSDYTDKRGQTLMHYVSGEENGLEVLKLLIQSGANINAKDKGDITPLHIASGGGFIENVKILLQYGADTNLGRNYRPLHIASAKGYVDVVQALLAVKTDVDFKDRHSWTALHYAAINKQNIVIKLLLDAKADVNAKVLKHLSTPFHLATQKGNGETAQMLLEAGADVLLKDEDGNTPFHLATRFNNPEIVKAIIQHGVDVNVLNGEGKTALHFVGYFYSEKYTDPDFSTAVAEVLLNTKGVKVNVKDMYGLTALDYAMKNKNEAYVQLLLSKGATSEVSLDDQEL